MNKDIDHSNATRDFGFSPVDFETGLSRQVTEMREAGLL